jgi:membrane protease subunit (stomatin/prohibitin family)
MASRSSNGLFVATHAGNNGESHNHNDVGDFVVYANGNPVIIDAGSGTYTARTFSKDRYKLWFNKSPYHNLPVVNGSEQLAGKKYAATDVQYQQNKKYSQLSMSIVGAYSADADIKSWLRKVKMNKDKDMIEVKDSYSMNTKPASLTQTFMTVCSADISTPGKIIFILPDQSKVCLNYDKKLWSASKEKMRLTTPEDEGLKHSWEGRDIWRVLLTGKSLNAHQSITYLIHK